MGFKRFVLYSPRDQKNKNKSNTTAQSHPTRKPHRQSDNNANIVACPKQIHSHAIPSERPGLATDGDMKAPDDVLDDCDQVLRAHRRNKFSCPILFERLNVVNLPPPFPLKQSDQLSRDELWTLLQNTNDTFQQAFPTTIAGDNPFAKAFMEKGISNHEVFYGYMFSALMRDAYSARSDTRKKRQLAFQYYAATVEAVNNNLQRQDTACSDENILAAAMLAYHPLLDEKHIPTIDIPRQSRGPLESLRLLHLYGSQDRRVTLHLEGVTRMVELRGGTQGLTMPGHASAVSYMDIILACQVLQSPRFDFAPYSGTDFHVSLLAYRRPDHPLGQMGSGFDAIVGLNSSAASLDLQKALDYLSLYSLGVDDYAAGRDMGSSLPVLAEQRNFVQHKMMTLMNVRLTQTLDDGERIIAVSYLAGVIYSLLCVFPLPGAPLRSIIQRIKSYFMSYNFSYELERSPELITWILCMTGIASAGQPERSWVISKLVSVLDGQQLDTWEDVGRSLQRFLWLPRTNEQDGMILWNESLCWRMARLAQTQAAHELRS